MANTHKENDDDKNYEKNFKIYIFYLREIQKFSLTVSNARVLRGVCQIRPVRPMR